MIIKVRPRVLRRRLALVGLGAIAAAGMLTLPAPPAHADRVDDYVATDSWRVCTILDRFPTFAGISGIADAIVNEGYTYAQAGRIEALSVIITCPRHQRLIDQFIAAYTGPAAISETYAA